MSGSPFYDTDALGEIANNLFYGWGYNFYRLENQLRADDQMVRSRAGLLLGQARASVEQAETEFRREHLPAPTRANPYPDPAAVERAQTLERVVRAIGAVASRLQSLPTPENDRMTERYRGEAETLVALGDCDRRLIGQSETLRAAVAGQSAAAILEGLALLNDGVAALEETLRQRQMILA